MPNFIVLTSLAVFTALAATGTLFPAVEVILDFVVAGIDSAPRDIDAKFVTVSAFGAGS